MHSVRILQDYLPAISHRGAFIGLIFLLGLSLWSPALLAQDKKEQMQVVSNEAMEKFQKNEFEAAAKGFEQAYGIFPEDVLLKNATIAWFSGGVCEDAERTGIAYIEATESQKKELLKDRRDVKTVVARCRLRAAQASFNAGDVQGAKQSLEGIELYSPEGKDAEQLIALRKQIEAKEKESGSSSSRTEDGSDSPKIEYGDRAASAPPSQSLKIIGFGLVGLGAVGGTITLIDQITLEGRVNDECGNDGQGGTDQAVLSACLKSETEKGNTRAIVLGATSGVFAITGGAFLLYYFLEKKAYDEKQVTILPVLGQDRAGASVHVRF